jgi:U3 small nucleolar RNA-associated protein 19
MALLLCPSSRRPNSVAPDDQLLDLDVANLFYETWFSVHDDIRWFFLRESV